MRTMLDNPVSSPAKPRKRSARPQARPKDDADDKTVAGWWILPAVASGALMWVGLFVALW
jgi:hypothetical protein